MLSDFSQFALVYLVHRVFVFIGNFIHHWYIDGSRFFFTTAQSIFLQVERTFAVSTTLGHFFEPLYQDYSIVGIIIGPLFRLGRVLTGIVVYILLGVPYLCLYLVWIGAPIGLFFYIFIPHP